MRSSTAVQRRPIPLARSIRWEPVSAVPRVPGILEPLVFVTQGLLREVARHLTSDPEQELLGFLLGELFECPETGKRYVVLFAASRTGYAIPEGEPTQIPEEQWLGVQLEVRRRRIPLAGWYHSAAFVGGHPARRDAETQRTRFPEPFQVGLVMTTEGSAPAGGFYRALPSDGGIFLPFYELLDDDAMLEGGRRRTVIEWQNYRTSDLVERDEPVSRGKESYVPPMPPIGMGPGATAPREMGLGEMGLREPGAHDMGARDLGARDLGAREMGARDPFSRSMAQLPVVIPSPARTGEMPLIPPAMPRRLRMGAFPVALLTVIAAGLAIFVWSQRDITGPPGTTNVLAQLRGVISGASTTSPNRNAYSAAAESLTARSATADSLPDTVVDTSTPNATMAAVPPANAPVARADSPAAQGRNAGASAASSTTSSATVASSDTPATVAAPVASAASTSATPPAPTSDARAVAFDAVADSLEIAIRNFQVRDADFAQRRISCSGLATGYRGADDAFIALATSYRSAAAALDNQRAERYQALTGEMEQVNTQFDASKCERP